MITTEWLSIYPKGNVLTLDWDIEYDTVRDSVSFGVLRRFFNDNRELKDVYIRRSSGGNTHVFLVFNNSLTTLEKYQLRYLLRDDILRIKLDNLRDLIENGRFNVGNYRVGGASGTGRLFDWKIENGDLGESGEWVLAWPSRV